MTKENVDLKIAQSSPLQSIEKVAEAKLGLLPDQLECYGKYKAKLSGETLRDLKSRPDGKLILVTAVSPTPAGEGKTTTAIGLCDGMNRLGRKAMLALREPSLGPCFGMKGGATGGGYAQVGPMEDINLHFTGDFHGITLAHNLLAAMLDNHLQQGNPLDIDQRRIFWKRVVDMNDRALRNIVIGLGGKINGVPRESSFDITAASEVMAIFCLAEDIADLKARLGRIVVAENRAGEPITAADLKAVGAMTALLKDAIRPNLVQTLEGNAALVHGGPFANIAHGCNSVAATRAALKLADYVVTEAGFGADLGAEKFIDIKCRQTGLRPTAVVLVATLRALKYQGGVARADLELEDPAALERGLVNLGRHLTNVQEHFGMNPVLGLNRFSADHASEVAVLEAFANERGVPLVLSDHWARGGEGAEELAAAVLKVADAAEPHCTMVYEDDIPLWSKIEQVATKVYGAGSIRAMGGVQKELLRLEEAGYGALPVCIAKNQYSFSGDPKALGAPSDHVLEVREVRLAAGAGFIVAVSGAMQTMPGLPKVSAAENIDVDDNGRISGLS